RSMKSHGYAPSSVASPAVAADRDLDLLQVLGEVLLDLLVGDAEVAEDPFVQVAGRRDVALALAQDGFHHRGSEERVLPAGLSHPRGQARGWARPSPLPLPGFTSTVCPLAGGEGRARRRYICCAIERTLLVKM